MLKKVISCVENDTPSAGDKITGIEKNGKEVTISNLRKEQNSAQEGGPFKNGWSRKSARVSCNTLSRQGEISLYMARKPLNN